MARLYTILLADDDLMLLEVVAQVLAEPGYVVLTATDGYEAIRVLTERHVDLMITDIKMPGLSGFELAAQAKLIRPRLHIIYISGYYTAAERGKQRTFGILLQKPVRGPDLLVAIQKEMTRK